MEFLYIVGRGHSGTTVLDIVLGKAFGFRSCGELVSGLSRYPSQKCTCGKLMQDCETWSASLDILENKYSIKDQKERKNFFQSLSSFATIFVFVKWFFINKKEKKRILAAEKDFVHQSGEGYKGVIDSSKELGRGWVLACGPVSASWVHIYRNPAQVAGSYRYRASKGRKIKIYRRLFTVRPFMLPLLDLFVATTWSVWTTATVFLGLFSPKKYSCVKYEGFFQDPYNHVVAISKRLDVPLDKDFTCDSFKESFRVGHIVGGNRLTENREVSVLKSGSTSRKVPRVTLFICYLICFPTMILVEAAYFFTTKRNMT